MLMFGADGWWNDPTDPRQRSSIPAGMQGDQLVRQQMAIADAEALNQVPWYMRPPGQNERPNPVYSNPTPLDPSDVQRQFQPQRNQMTREAYERMLSNPSSFSGGPLHSESSSWARTLANTQSPFGGPMAAMIYPMDSPGMSQGIGSMFNRFSGSDSPFGLGSLFSSSSRLGGGGSSLFGLGPIRPRVSLYGY